MQVIATKNGFYGRYIEPGEAFVLSDPKHFSERWMRKPSVIETARLKPAPEKRSRAKKVKDEPVTLKDVTDSVKDEILDENWDQ